MIYRVVIRGIQIDTIKIRTDDVTYDFVIITRGEKFYPGVSAQLYRVTTDEVITAKTLKDTP